MTTETPAPGDAGALLAGSPSVELLTLDLLRDSVQDLRSRIEKPTSRLSKWLPISISAVALALSLVATAHGMLQDRARELSSRRAELRSVLATLIETNSSVAERAGTIEDLSARSLFVSQAAAKVHLLAQEADRLFAEADTELTPAQYLILGDLFLQVGDPEKALRYMELAVAASQTPIERAYAERNLAKVYFLKASSADLERGRTLFAGAEEAMRGSNHPYVIFQRGFTLETWAEMEAFRGNLREAAEGLRQAQQAYQPVAQADGGIHLQRVNTRLAQLAATPRP
jgi:tetratricopeptide (TPR) repeat protein